MKARRPTPRRGPNRWSREEWEEITLRLLGRDGDRCAACGLPLRGDADRHHRQRRRDGGDTIENVVLLHHACHMDVHAHPERSRELGLIVSAWADPATAGIRMPGVGWCWLTAEGTRLLSGPAEP